MSQENFDYPLLNKELDRTKSKVFLGSAAAFFGPLMCSLQFEWNEDEETCSTDGQTIWWGPADFLECTPDERVSSLLHELGHVYRLHMLRRGQRCPDVWNIACDIVINRDLLKMGYSIGDDWIPAHLEIPFEAEEDIYDYLKKPGSPQPQKANCCGGINEPKGDAKHAIVNSVVSAIHQAKASGQPGSIPGSVELTIEKFLAPVIPWEAELYQFFTDLSDEDFTWKRPNRRHQEIYLPSRMTDDGRLEHLAYYLDVSGSISDHDILRFNSEVKYIKDTFNPVKLTLVQFDTRITDIIEITEDDAFEKTVVVGRGGTDLRPVREHIELNKPTAAIIFTDLHVQPMMPLTLPIPVIWATTTSNASVPFGKVIRVREKTSNF